MNKHIHLTNAFKTTPVKKIGNYPYPISPFAGITGAIEPETLKEVAQFVKNEDIFSQADLLVTFETAGIHLTAVISQVWNLPYLVARKKKFDLQKEIYFSVKTNFDKKEFFLYGDLRGKKIIIVDDIIASGSTQKAAVIALEKAGSRVIALFAVAGKNNTIGQRYQDNLKNLNMPLITMMEIQVIGGKVVVK